MNKVAENNRRIAKNTLFLYLRMILVMAVSLYTSRVILKALGVDDFGLYDVIGGIVALFSILSGSLTSAISRFLTYELGKGNSQRLKQIFSSSVFIQLMISLVVILALAPLGLWFINAKLNVPPDRYVAAYWVFGFSILTFCLHLLSVPYNAAIISHEKMAVFSYISLIEVSFKLLIAYCINLFAQNRLIIYAAMLFGVVLVIQLIYAGYCIRKFPECKLSLAYDRGLLKEIGSFAGWNFIGSAAGVLRNQGNNIILNLFYGTVANAAYSICMQVNNAVNQLADNFMVSVNPQITKYYAQSEIKEMNNLMFRSARMSFFLSWLLASVILLNTEYILNLWLAKIPDHTVIFVQLILWFTITESVSKPLITGMLATGKIKNYQIVVGGLQMLNLPISYVLLKLGAAPQAPLAVSIGVSLACLSARLVMLRGLMPFDSMAFIKKVILRVILVGALSFAVPYFIKLFVGETSGFITFLWESAVCLCWTVAVIYYIGCDNNERRFIRDRIVAAKHKFIK